MSPKANTVAILLSYFSLLNDRPEHAMFLWSQRQIQSQPQFKTRLWIRVWVKLAVYFIMLPNLQTLLKPLLCAGSGDADSVEIFCCWDLHEGKRTIQFKGNKNSFKPVVWRNQINLFEYLSKSKTRSNWGSILQKDYLNQCTQTYISDKFVNSVELISKLV